MEGWQKLLSRALGGLDAMAADGHAVPHWIFGGGTALMVQTMHRRSKDIDIFFPDAQYLSILSPKLLGENVWNCEAYDEATHYLKLKYAEGEIDFIVSSPITELPSTEYHFQGRGIPMEDPVEIAIKKMFHRGSQLKPRDIFDIAVVARDHEGSLIANLAAVSHKRADLMKRLDNTNIQFYRQALDDLDILDEWDALKGDALEITKGIVAQIPETPSIFPQR